MRGATRRLAATAVAGVLALAACQGGDELAPPDVEQPVAPTDEPEPAPEPTEPDGGTDAPAEPAEPVEPTEEPDDQAAGVAPLAGEPGTELVEEDGAPGDALAVTGVRVGTHDGFDRVVLELDGDGTAGWFVYYDEPRSQGSGEPVIVAGAAALHVALSNVTLPPELPDDIEPWFQRELLGPENGIVLEVRDDTIFEGMHLFFVGLDTERPFLVDRLDDPQRVVIDVFHGT